MSKSISCVLALGLLLLTTALGCTEPEPTQAVQMGGGLLDMAISEQWALESEDDKVRVYAHKEIANLRLRIEIDAEDFGQALRVVDVKALIGRELNMAYGGVSTRVSLGGNAMIRYARLAEDMTGQEVQSEEWVIAKPFAASHVARIEISLHVPDAAKASPLLPGIIESLDKRVGDAKIPVA